MAKVNTSKFMGMGQSGLEKKVDANSQKITLLKNIIKIQQSNIAEQLKSLSSDEGGGFSSGLDESIKSITNSVTSISETLKNTHQFEKDKAADERQDKESSDRNKSEKDSEKTKFSGLKETAKKVLAPVQNMFAKAFEWLKKLFFAKVAIGLWDWLSNPENQGKVKSIVRFFADWWPLMLGGYLLFGTGFGAMIATLVPMIVGFTAKLIGTVIPALIKAAASMGPWGWAALAALGVGAGAAFMANRNKKQRDKDNQKDDASTVTPQEFAESRKDDDKSNDQTPSSAQLMNEYVGQRGLGGMFNEGGQVPGRGPNKDTVPAMLTPGEFVMSRDAVDKWGADVLAGMNAAAGGTNKPTPMSGYNEGGFVSSGGDMGGDSKDESRNNYKEGVKKLFAGYADVLTADIFDFDNRGSMVDTIKKKTEKIIPAGKDFGQKKYAFLSRIVGGVADHMTMGLTDFDRKGSSGFQFNPVGGGINKKWGVEPPPRRTSTVAYAQAQAKAQASGTLGSNSSGPGGNDIPNFPVGTKVSSDKIKVLGITR